jgi:Cu/Ag efflux protein CusF
MMKAVNQAPVLGLFALLSACGGSGGNGPTPANGSASTVTGMNTMAPGSMDNMAMPVAAGTATGTGTVQAIDRAASTITVDHGPIPEAGWPAMTMTFKTAPAVIASVKQGDKISFDLKLANGSGEVIAVRKI